ncbi:transposase family protein [Streptomyces sp. NPDC058301]|uniref:transposase family protein n=1 Tax=Streptomyces sp. NPDC058301 TaxID=3346436 RepID=UPI0036F00B75
MLVTPSSFPSALLAPKSLPPTAREASQSGAVVPSGLLDALARVPDPRNPRGVRFRLATLLAVGVCALTSAGHNSLTAIAEWVRRCDQDVLARLGCPFAPSIPSPDGSGRRASAPCAMSSRGSTPRYSPPPASPGSPHSSPAR